MRKEHDYQKMIWELLTDGIEIERIALNTHVSIPTLYRIKRGIVPRALAARKASEIYYDRVTKGIEKRINEGVANENV